MVNRGFISLHFVFGLGVFQQGVTAVIQTQQTVLAAVGEEASLNCQLLETKDVVQVTWKKISPEKKNLAISNKYYGQWVKSDKIEFKETGLQNSAIIVRNVTQQDEGCYACLFNTDPGGALIGRTCLQLYELHEPILSVRESDSSEELVVSCSATGRPAPSLTLDATQQHVHLSHYDTVTVNNTNGTVTVTTTAVLSGLHGNSTQIGCAARVLSAPQLEVFMMLPQVKQTSADGSDGESGSDKGLSQSGIALLVTATMCAFCIIGGAVVKRRFKGRRSEIV